MTVRRWPGRHGRATPVPGRHFDDGRSLQAFADRVAVCCHRCDTPGWVIARWEPYRWTARFRCTGCSSALDSGDWVGAVCMLGRQPCGFCGHQWLHVCRRIPAGMPAPASFPARCAQCDRSTEVTVTTRPCVTRSRPIRISGCRCDWSNRPARACCGLTTPNICRHCTNSSATLREGRGHHRSMFSRLPQWMKLARNRVLLQRAVARLQGGCCR